MIGRLAATAGAVTPVAAAAVDKAKGAMVQQPTVWFFFGYPFEAAGMVAALFGCIAARYWVGAAQAVRKEHRWSLDVPVSAMTLGASAALVIAQRPGPLTALMIGAGLGVIGEGIFKIAERMVKASGAFGADDHEAGINRAMGKLDKID